MKHLEQYQNIYFLGIGGIGMSALARYFHAQGKNVSGYDRTETVLTQLLVREGMSIHYVDTISEIQEQIDLIIYTPAIPKDNQEFQYLEKSGIPMIKRSAALGLISQGSKAICIAGTHGKTTTSTWTTHVLKTGKVDVSAFLGGISVDYGSNNIIGSSEIVVIEADEYDRSFLQLSPWMASVSSMDPDHLDIYGDDSSMKEGFKKFIHLIQANGYLIIKKDLLDHLSDSDIKALKDKNVQIIDFGFDDATIQISNVSIKNGKFVFDYSGLGHEISGIVSNMPGKHNIENACVAITCGLICGIEVEDIKVAISNFKGIQRRFEHIVETSSSIYIDDYAHHPSELQAAIEAARMLYPHKKLTGIFQPHLYSRTRDFADGFAEVLSQLDEVILMDIYPARELPIDGVSSEIIFDKIANENKLLVTKDQLMTILDHKRFDVLLTLGAGDIDTFVPKIKKYLESIG
ncbi:MAG: UDP-N-acetylmuramate--L-alanine ligase [Lewinellaceae bacterium]|nr:UDP-N-acetylmuramate--L-alanine ligase [Lewinellaceae bacterium]